MVIDWYADHDANKQRASEQRARAEAAGEVFEGPKLSDADRAALQAMTHAAGETP